MVYKSYDCKTFKVHTIKLDKFKTCHIEIIFSKKVVKDSLSLDSMLCDILTEVSNKYKTKREVIIHCEELYKTFFWGVTNKVGNILNTSFMLDFISPKYINDESYLENVIKFPFEMILNPLVKDNEFDLKNFTLIKDRLLKDIDSIIENPIKNSCRKALETMDPDSITAMFVAGTKETITEATPASLYDHYKRFFKDHVCNIFVIGQCDMDEIVRLIKKYYKNRIINNYQIDFYIDNKIARKSKMVIKQGNYGQANIVMLYNIVNLTKEERDIVFYLYNYILGNGGLTSKLYQKIRIENSLCYAINSMYLKYDKLLLIQISLDNENIKKAITLAKKCLTKMMQGDFTLEELTDAQNNLNQSLVMSLDNNVTLINNYIFNILDDFPLLEERIKLYKKVTKEQIIKVAKKLKLNTIFVLKGEK